ncbi:MAG: hypothetical protein FJ038_12995, partial [Chloroflexi bacterium]|nr:hypothetical protein [Chloroflexota bacterium]
APQPLRGRRNEPAFVAHTAAAIARERGLAVSAMEALLAANARALFGARWG